MSAPPSRLPVLRVKLPCDDEKDFFARLADTIAEKGLRIPTANLRPVGSRVRLVLEFRNAEAVNGEGIIDAHLEGARPSMNIRILKFERSRPGAPAAVGVVPAVTPAPVLRPVPPAPAPTAAPAAAAPASTPAAASRASPPETSFASLFEEEQEAAPVRDVVPAPPPPADATEQLEPLYGDAGSTPEPLQAAVRKGGSLPAASRRAAVAAIVAAALLVVGILAYSFARRPAAPAVPVREAAPPAAGVADAQLADRIAIADRRLSEGRLTGPDGALDHLLAAKAMAPGDARLKERLALLADTLEKLGGRALERGDVREAEVHLAAALQAAPDRASISAKLDALAKLPQAREARLRGDQPPTPGESK